MAISMKAAMALLASGMIGSGIGHAEQPSRTPQLCTAIRGNGENIFAHFGAMAKVLEEKGVVDGLAGGSSASMTMFLYESMLANPALYRRCIAETCSREELGDRTALLMKSVMQWIGITSKSSVGQDALQLTNLSKHLATVDINKLQSSDIRLVQAGLDSLYRVVNHPQVQSLINPEFVQFVFDPKILRQNGLSSSSRLLRYRAGEAAQAVLDFGKFEATDPVILLRPGLLNFKGLAAAVGRISNFYAGRIPHLAAPMEQFLLRCSAITRGKTWREIMPDSCGQEFDELAALFLRKEALVVNPRVDEIVGKYASVLVSTSVLVDEQVEFLKTKRRYFAGYKPHLDFELDSVLFGYTGQAADTLAASNVKERTDAKSQRFFALEPMSWRRILALSPAEPGLANAQAFESNGVPLVSFGGWSDLTPTLVLQELGCTDTVYITRKGEDSRFAMGVADLSGLKPVHDQLYDTRSRDSSYQVSIHEASSVLCSDWNAYSPLKPGEAVAMFEESYRANLVDPNASEDLPVGCGGYSP